MSKSAPVKDSDFFTRRRGSQKSKASTPPTEQDEENPSNMADLSAVLVELKSLRSVFGSKLDSIDDRLGKVANSVTALENSMSEVRQNVAANTTRMEEAENRIMSAEEQLDTSAAALTNAMKRIAYLETKTEDLENRSRRNNLRIFGIREGAEGNQTLLDFMQNMLPRWLGLDTDRTFTLERAHRTLAPPKPNQDRAVLIRFLKFQDREFVFRAAKQREIMYEGNKIVLVQDLSAETMRQRFGFNKVKKLFMEKGTFRGFELNPCKMRVLHDGRIRSFSSPKEAEDFYSKHV